VATVIDSPINTAWYLFNTRLIMKFTSTSRTDM
jgi:hypothetical protein